MSGGIAYVLDELGDFHRRCNQDMIYLERLEEEEIDEVKAMIKRHAEHTKSQLALKILRRWNEMVPKFVKVMPKDYKRMLNAVRRVRESGISGEEAIMAAFEENKRDLARVSGN
jgi:glutamate synthase (ferredoxin)